MCEREKDRKSAEREREKTEGKIESEADRENRRIK